MAQAEIYQFAGYRKSRRGETEKKLQFAINGFSDSRTLPEETLKQRYCKVTKCVYKKRCHFRQVESISYDESSVVSRFRQTAKYLQAVVAFTLGLHKTPAL